MVATRYDEIDRMDAAYSHISYKAKIHPSVRIEPFCVIEDDVEIGADTIIGPFNHIRNGTRIGKNCKIGGHCVFEGRGSTVGDNSRLGTHCNIGFACYVGDNVFIGGNFTGGNDKFMKYPNPKFEPDPYVICDGARIGLSMTIMPRVNVGFHSMVGAGSLVTRNVPNWELWYGSPAKKHGIVPKG